ncbi:MAG: amidohydrolase family protein [Alicyclobacillus sp.]|nr:amidohydrolase family protein [Alicyclobacillus sp.]
MSVRIDAHQHYWQVERGDYGWLTPDLGILYRDYLPQDLAPVLAENDIDRTIVVQAAPTVEETQFLLQLADRTDTVAGVVGWLDFEDERFEQQLASLRKHPKLVGLRPMIQDIPDDRWMLRPQVVRSFKVLEAQGFPVDLLVHPRHLPVVLELLGLVPNLRAVVDHLAKPFIRDGQLDPWREQIAAIAAAPNVMCKLSGMVTEAGHTAWTSDHFRPYVEHAVSVFGLDRVMFGSDWPVCLQAATYTQVREALLACLEGLASPADLDNVFGHNAARFYHIQGG